MVKILNINLCGTFVTMNLIKYEYQKENTEYERRIN